MTLQRRTPLRSAGSIAGAVLLAIVALALHPHIAGHLGPQAELRELGRLSVRGELVHGTLLILVAALLIGFTRYARGRGLSRQPVVAGLVTFTIGIGGLFAAGLIDGFVFPELAAQFVAASPAVQGAAVATLTACSVVVNVLTAFATVAMAVAIGAWSLDLAREPGETRVAGVVGFVCAATSAAVLVMGGPYLTPHTLIAVVCAQGVWYVWIALLVARGQASRRT